MSEIINNSETRKEQLKAIIKQIHNGMNLADAKKLFKSQFDTVSTDEITKMEQSLMEEGMPIEEVQKLCDVHSAVFEGSISDIHKQNDKTEIPGHPIKVFLDENIRLEHLLLEEVRPYIKKYDKTSHLMLRIGIERLQEISKHYSRKENLFFPGIEKRGLTSIPKVMWGVDNEIRESLKKIKKGLDEIREDYSSLHTDLVHVLNRVADMIMKENQILTPLLLEKLSLYDWILADEGSDEIGYFLDAPVESWSKKETKEENQESETLNGLIKFDAGFLSQIEVNAMLNTLPLDMTFVDKDDKVKYFTQGTERIFDRPKTVLGRDVSMCHPPQSVHVVTDILNSFKSGEKEYEDFYINMGPMFVYIRYFAVKGKDKEYLGCLEITQNIKPIRELQGEKRLLDTK